MSARPPDGMLKVHVLDELYHHSSNVAHGPELKIEIEAIAAKID